MVETHPEKQDEGWSTLVEFAKLPDEGAVLCMGERSAALATLLGRRGHRSVAVSSESARPGSGVSLLVTDPQTMGLLSGAFAVVALIDLFHRQKDPEAALAEARRVAGPGGLLLIQEPVAEGAGSECMTLAEFCAHLAGERLAVLAHRQVEGDAGNLALWLLRVPHESPESPRTFIQEDR